MADINFAKAEATAAPGETPPEDAAAYTHRSGRTGRAGAEGVVISLVDAADLDARGRLRRPPAPGVEFEGTTTDDLLAGELPADGKTFDVLICGMAGARQGWMEAPYLDAPADLGGLRFAAVTPRGANARLAPKILPGVCQKLAGAEDVMRGEETQVLGLSALRPGFAGTAILPGTHSKWIAVDGRRIERFATSMTGELFDVIPTSLVLLVAVVLFVWLPFRRSVLGRGCYAAGSAEGAAYMSGVDINRSKLAAYMLCGLLAGIAGLMQTFNTYTGEASAPSGGLYTLNSIAAVVNSRGMDVPLKTSIAIDQQPRCLPAGQKPAATRRTRLPQGRQQLIKAGQAGAINRAWRRSCPRSSPPHRGRQAARWRGCRSAR